MDTKQPLSLFLVAILAASVFTLVGISSLPVQKATAQDVTIETSADELGGTFYGESFLQVVIEDEDSDVDEDAPDDISVTIEIDPDDGTTVSKSIDVPETGDSTGRFEFFLIHEDSDNIDEGDLDSIADVPYVVVFGPDAASVAIAENDTIDVDVTIGAEDAAINIDTGDVDLDLDYAQDEGTLTLDRDTPYGSTSFIHLFITDQDSNNDPTNADSFDVLNAVINGTTFDELFELTGGNFGSGSLNFTETGDNTAEFEVVLEITDDNTGADNELVFTSDSLTLEYHDHADLRDIADADGDVVEDSTDTSEVSFEIEDSDGEMDDLGDLTFNGELVVTVRDDDQNLDSEEDDTIPDALEITTEGDDVVTVDLEETDDNTGVFQIDLANSELRITFVEDAGAVDDTDDILQLAPEDIEGDIFVSYIDPLDDDSDESEVVSVTLAMALVAGALSAPEDAGVNDEFTVTLNDNDLNDNPRTSDSYTIELDGEGEIPIQRGGVPLDDIYTFEFELDGEVLDFGTFGDLGNSNVTITIRETGINTGIFEFDIDMEDLQIIGDGDDDVDTELLIDDGSDLEVTINDHMADVADPDDDSVTITIGKPDVDVDFSRTTVPIPPEDGSVTGPAVGTTMITTLIVTDPQRATQSNVEESFDFVFGTGAGNFTIEIEGDDVVEGTIASLEDFFGADEDDCDIDGGDGEALIIDAPGVDDDVAFCAFMGIDPTEASADDTDELENLLEETGKATGVFEWEMEFDMDGPGLGIDPNSLQDAEISITYFDDEGDDQTAGFTFRGNDGIVTVDQGSAKSGTVITISVEDQDLNLDDAETETFDAAAGGLLSMETEDDEIDPADGGSCAAIDFDAETFEETGDDTGVFMAEFVVGEDIPVACVDGDGDSVQATNILITYDDEIDSTGGGGDELEVNVPVVSSTGSIQVTPELVGPATELTVLVIDSDLDEDANSIGDFDCDGAGDDYFISFSSDRNEVGEDCADLEETGPNTGVFMFTLQLETDEAECTLDELGADLDADGDDTDSTIGACPGDLIAIRYEDEATGSGGSAAVSEVIEVMSFDPEFVADQESYNIDDRVTVTISDPDANRDADIADSLTDIRVRSDSDQVGEELSALETGRDTGVFRLSFGLTSGTASGSITVKTGDDVTITYTDEFPADFEEEEEDKDFQFVIPVGGGGTVGTTSVTPPELQDVTGQTLDEISAGQQVVLTTDVINNEASATPFVALIEVRDSSGITVFLAWQTGTLPANDRTQVGLSWTAEFPGDYTVRTFVISDLANPDVLSEVSETDITVS